MWALLMVVVLVMPSVHGWGSSTYVCNMDGEDVKILTQLLEKTSEVNFTVGEMERKLDRILHFVEHIQKQEDAWMGNETAHLVIPTLTDISKTELATVTSSPKESDIKINLESNLEKENEKTLNEDKIIIKDKAITQVKNEGDKKEKEEEEEQTMEVMKSDTIERELEKRWQEYVQQRDIEQSLEGPEKGGCRAMEVQQKETVGMFFMTSYRYGHCANRRPISFPIRFCLGYCVSKTFIERSSGLWEQAGDCTSCQPLLLETVRIPLVCDSGFVFEKDFENVVECRCLACEATKS